MARMIMKSGHETWYPDLYKVKSRELLDPNLTPNENIWSFIYKVTCVWLTKARVFALTQEDMEELEQDVRLATYLRLRYVVVTKQYRRDFSFWVNCTRCCYSICHSCIQRWMDKLNVRKNLLCGDEPLSESNNSETFFDSRSFNPTLITSSENWSAQKLKWQDAQRPFDRWKKINETVDNEYLEYTESCLELSVTPVDKDTFVLTNYTEEERKIMSEEPTQNLTYRNYFKNWIARKKLEDPAWIEKKRIRDRRYQRKYNEKRKAERRRKKSKGGSDDAT